MMLEKFPRLDETEAAVAQNKKTNACRKEKAILMPLISLEELLKKYWTYMMLLDLQQRLIDFTCYILVRKLAIEEITDNNKKSLLSPILRERLGHHIHGEIWATNIKEVLKETDF
jgi:hypothetical protein